jgi:thiol-disulfide isomerase/thioredoxin
MLKPLFLSLCLGLSVSACTPDGQAETVPGQSASSPARAPEFQGIDNWINSPPLTLAQLKGKVVLVEFWTYSCINCIHVTPYVKGWRARYKDRGLVVVGVHTPEYGYEKVPANVESAVKRFGIQYPVAQDNRYDTWQAYGNNYWPAIYLIDRDGRVVYRHFGEGDYAQTEARIQQLLATR